MQKIAAYFRLLLFIATMGTLHTSCNGVEDMLANLPPGWRVVEFDDFIMGVPPTLEEFDPNLPFYKAQGLEHHKALEDFRIFLPRGWGNYEGDDLMCNVCIMRPSYAPESLSAVPWAHIRPKVRKREIEKWYKFLIGGQDPTYMIGEPKVKTVRIFGGINAMRGITRWRLPGQEDYEVIVAGAYLLFDKTRGTQIQWRYPEKQADKWQKDIDYMVHTFRWK